MAKFLIYNQSSFEVEANDEVEARKKAEETLHKLEESCKKVDVSFKVESAKVADKRTGYFLG